MKHFKYLLVTAALLISGTHLAAQSIDEELVACENSYQELQENFWAYEQSTRADLYDYIETNMDHERAMQDIGECLKLDSADAIRECVKPHISLYVH